MAVSCSCPLPEAGGPAPGLLQWEAGKRHLHSAEHAVTQLVLQHNTALYCQSPPACASPMVCLQCRASVNLQLVEDGVLRLVNLQVLGAKEALGKDGLAVFSQEASCTPVPGSHQAVRSRGSSHAGGILHWACACNVVCALMPICAE